jgi:hypothetical protein
LYIFRFFFLYETGRQKILVWIIASIPRISSKIRFLVVALTLGNESGCV